MRALSCRHSCQPRHCCLRRPAGTSPLGTRTALASFLEQQGAHVGSAVSRSTSLLLTGETTPGGSKLKKAQELGVRVMPAEEFMLAAGWDPASASDS